MWDEGLLNPKAVFPFWGMVPLLEGRSTACAVKSGSCNGNRGRRSAYLILASQVGLSMLWYLHYSQLLHLDTQVQWDRRGTPLLWKM